MKPKLRVAQCWSGQSKIGRSKKIIVAGLLFFCFVLISGYLYWNTERTIDFAQLLPEEITFCSRMISGSDVEYMSLRSWLENNHEGWVNTLVSYAQKDYFQSESMTINVLKDGVVINYSPDGHEWSQVSKSMSEFNLNLPCKPGQEVHSMDKVF